MGLWTSFPTKSRQNLDFLICAIGFAKPSYSNDCIFIPSNEPHGLENIGESILRYFSAASPPFTKEELINFWPIESESKIK